MKKLFLYCFLSICADAIFPSRLLAQKVSYDLITYLPPQGWKKEIKENSILYTRVNKKNNSWCQIGIVKSTKSKGNINRDFENEWQELIVKSYNPTDTPQINAVEELNGWKIKAGSGAFTFNNAQAIAMLTTASGFDRCVSIVVITNSEDYTKSIETLLSSVDLKNPETIQKEQEKETEIQNNSDVKNSGFAYAITNFDDGWASIVQEDWVEVTKGNIKVLLHYPKEGTVFPADPEPLTNTAWNILVAPRYSNLKNYRTAYITTYDRPYLGMGYATENSTGKEVFVLLFRQGGGWIEFITPDKETFIQQYKFDPETVQWDADSDLMSPLTKMSGYNRFAVAASDFKGKWTSDFTGIQQMYHIYTGNYAGMNMHQSNIIFDFKGGNSYYWKLIAVNGMVGNLKFDQVESTGTFSVPNSWQLKCSKIEKGPKLYHAFWSCIKGARILNLLDADAPGSGIYTQFGLAK